MYQKKKVLIIDDEKDLCLLLKDYFLRKNYDVTLSHTLTEGKELLYSLKPDILFLDNNLPDEEGWDNAPAFASQFPNTYFVLISAYHPEIPDMPSNAKFQIIEKPISFTDLDKNLLGNIIL
jgi:DNA-binding NtrC family response regulator